MARGSLLAAAACALLALAAAAVPSPSATTVSYAAVTSPTALGPAGSPSARGLFFSYYSNWQFNLTTSAYPPINNKNYVVLRACLAHAAPPPALDAVAPGWACTAAAR